MYLFTKGRLMRDKSGDAGRGTSDVLGNGGKGAKE